MSKLQANLSEQGAQTCGFLKQFALVGKGLRAMRFEGIPNEANDTRSKWSLHVGHTSYVVLTLVCWNLFLLARSA